MRISLLFLGKTKERYLADGIDDYLHRLKRYVTAEIKVIKEKRRGDGPDKAQVQEEGRQLLEGAGSKSLLVALDPQGRAFSTEQLVAQLNTWEERGVQDVSFVIGGPLGLADEVKDQAQLLLSLSKMTFTHEMARLLLVEQLYRAFSIKAGSKYHK